MKKLLILVCCVISVPVLLSLSGNPRTVPLEAYSAVSTSGMQSALAAQNPTLSPVPTPTSLLTVPQTSTPTAGPAPIYTTSPITMWVCSDLAYGYAEADEKSPRVWQMASVDGWQVAFYEGRGDWYHVKAGDATAFMRASDLCFSRPQAYVDALATRAALPLRTPTPEPGVILLGDDLSADERRMLQDGLQHLKNCSPALYDYVRRYVREIHRGSTSIDKADAFVRTGSPVVYLPEKGSVNNPRRYTDSMRTFAAASLLVHEARHLEMGKGTTEPDAYRFELQVFTPQCKPNDISDAPWNLYIGMRAYVEWRASLPYPGEPPAGAMP